MGKGVYKVSTEFVLRSHAGAVPLGTGVDLTLKCTRRLDVDQHHTVEDVGIALGEAFGKRWETKRGLMRAGYFVMVPWMRRWRWLAVDLSGTGGVCRR